LLSLSNDDRGYDVSQDREQAELTGNGTNSFTELLTPSCGTVPSSRLSP